MALFKHEVGAKRVADGTLENADCLLIQCNTFTKHKKYFVNQKHKHVGDFLLEVIVLRLLKMCPLLKHDICTYATNQETKEPWICFSCRGHNLALSAFMIYHRIFSKSTTTGGTSGGGTIYTYIGYFALNDFLSSLAKWG